MIEPMMPVLLSRSGSVYWDSEKLREGLEGSGRRRSAKVAGTDIGVVRIELEG